MYRQGAMADVVVRGLDPRIDLSAKRDGLHRTSGLPEVRSFEGRKSGRLDVRGQVRQ
jgi:hypothetical protein